jgi:hypothetical protein
MLPIEIPFKINIPTHPQDVRLAAISNIGSPPKSIGHLPQPTLLCHRNMKSIGQFVLELWCGIWSADAETLGEHNGNAPISNGHNYDNISIQT